MNNLLRRFTSNGHHRPVHFDAATEHEIEADFRSRMQHRYLRHHPMQADFNANYSWISAPSECKQVECRCDLPSCSPVATRIPVQYQALHPSHKSRRSAGALERANADSISSQDRNECQWTPLDPSSNSDYFTLVSMPKGKPSSTASRLFLRSRKDKAQFNGEAAENDPSYWEYKGDCLWAGGDLTVQVTAINITKLSERESRILRKMALQKLKTNRISNHLGSSISIPRGESMKRRTQFSFKRKSKTSSVVDGQQKKSDKGFGFVFGIPLQRCIANEQRIESQRSLARRESLDLASCHPTEQYQRRNKLERTPSHLSEITWRQIHGGEQTDDTTLSDDGSSLLDALSLPLSPSRSSRFNRHRREKLLPSYNLRVPSVVHRCCYHLEKYGLQTLGIFRVGNSKRRVKQLKEDIDSGQSVNIPEDACPHDVGGLLKEFFRDLPDPLLTKDLYHAFVNANKAEKSEFETVLRWLICLLPVPNRDTLFSLLQFLAKVAEHSTDSVSADGSICPGNKMDARNLAILFGPNILRKQRNLNEKEFVVESSEAAEHSLQVIHVVKAMIENASNLFMLPCEVHNQILSEVDPEDLNFLMRKKITNGLGVRLYPKERPRTLGIPIGSAGHLTASCCWDEHLPSPGETIPSPIEWRTHQPAVGNHAAMDFSTPSSSPRESFHQSRLKIQAARRRFFGLPMDSQSCCEDGHAQLSMSTPEGDIGQHSSSFSNSSFSLPEIEWQRQQWLYWQRMAASLGDEQETLV